jgi:hypothetical protein
MMTFALNLKMFIKPGIVVHTYNLSTQETEAGGELWVQDQPGIYTKTLSQKTKQLPQGLFIFGYTILGFSRETEPIVGKEMGT